MCEFRDKLIPWLDRELSDAEAVAVERHLSLCAECRESVFGYQQASADFDALCSATFAASQRPRVPRWAVALGTAAVVAAVVALGFSRWHTGGQQPLHAPAAAARVAARTAVVSQIPPARPHARASRPMAAPETVHHLASPRTASLIQSHAAAQLPPAPVVEVNIPADAMFPPGAVPEGMNFVADFSVAPDGSAQGLRLQPRLASFERRTTQP